jgi:two-component system, chemotaxis family, CheB/CheR fusion protein
MHEKEVTISTKMVARNKKSPQTPTSKTTKKLNTLEAKKPAEPTNRPQGLTVVGIGASAGGLSALSSFLEALPPDTGVAFVVVQVPSHRETS